MPAKKRLLKSVKVAFISLVDKGANNKTVIYKSADPTKNTYQKTVEIKKFDEEQGLIYGIVYSPDQVDTDGDYTTAEVIKAMAYDFMKEAKTNSVDQQHDYVAKDGCYVAESWILKSGDPVFPGEPEGSWAVAIKVENEEIKKAVKDGEITGLSMAGLAVVEEVAKSDKSLIEKFTKIVKEGFANIKKDFNSQWNQEQLRRMSWAFTDSISEILNDENIADKKAEILKNVEQFKTAIEAFNFNTTTPVTKTNKEDIEMKPEEIAELAKNAVAEAVKPFADLQKSVDDLKKAQEDKNADLEKRLKTVEEITPGSAQVGADGKPVEKTQHTNAPIWL
ncbi:MAG: XkdF-like putative serine protease domain-containing protein [Clostridia bacterium]|nr:XkdF-like putative serine protease domain-containing protein [Clostridia bacterium]